MCPAETPGRIEPCLLEDHSPRLIQLCGDLVAAANDLSAIVRLASADAIASDLRVANAVFSFAIEGICLTHGEVADALEGRRTSPEAKMAASHVRVQEWIDRSHAAGAMPDPASTEFICDIHARLFDGLATWGAPGRMRGEGEVVSVGRHLPPSGRVVESFMAHYARRYEGIFRAEGSGADSGRVRAIAAIPAAHHRLSYIHPFLDGNGRVARLVTHAMCLAAGLGGAGGWSISAALVNDEGGAQGYLERMAAADAPRRGDLDGRGNLSHAGLEGFTTWFLQAMWREICAAQMGR